MAKGQKSSASSATRKKHAQKAGGDPLPLPKQQKQPKDKTKGKGKSKEPRIKQYILPTKPVAVNPDPIDALGLAKKLHPDLMVVLRRLGKKDSVTKRKALEDWSAGWVDVVVNGRDEGGIQLASLEMALHVWLHHLPALLLHTSRRIRQLTAIIHASLLRVPSILAEVGFFLSETGSTSLVESILGSWCMATQDVDRQVAMYARRAWTAILPAITRATLENSDQVNDASSQLDETSFSLLLNFVRRALLDPQRAYLDLNPIQPAFTPSASGTHTPTRGATQKGGGKHAIASPVPTPAPKTVDDEDCRSQGHAKTDEDEEDEDDRKGRLRIGALGVLKWSLEQYSHSNLPSVLSALLATPLLWTSLYHGPSPPFCKASSTHSDEAFPSGCLGEGQPLVRKSAWNLFLTLYKTHPEQMKSSLRILSSAVLRSAWVEPDGQVRAAMWEPLLLFIRHYPEAWQLDMETSAAESAAARRNEDDEHHSSDADSEDEQEEDDDNEEEEEEAIAHKSADNVTDEVIDENEAQSRAYRELLQFLQLGCYGSPVQGYPATVVILSSIPNTIVCTTLSSVTDFLASFWSALDGRALSGLDRAASSAAFLSALLESLILLIRRSNSVPIDEINDLLKGQVNRIVEELVAQRLKIDAEIAGRMFAKFMVGCEKGLRQEYFNAVWDQFSQSTNTLFATLNATSSTSMYIATLFKAMDAELKGDRSTQRLLHVLTIRFAQEALARCEQQLSLSESGAKGDGVAGDSAGLLSLLQNCGQVVFGDACLAHRLDKLVVDRLPRILTETPSLLITYVAHRGKEAPVVSAWSKTMSVIAGDEALAIRCLPTLLNGVKHGILPEQIRLEDENVMDTMAGRLVSKALGGSVAGANDLLEVVRGLLISPYAFLSRSAFFGLLHNIIFAFSEKARQLLRRHQPDASVSALRAPLDLISSIIGAHPQLSLSDDIRFFLPDFFMFGYLFHKASTEVHTTEGHSEVETAALLAKGIWDTCVGTMENEGPESVKAVRESVIGLLRDLIGDVDCCVAPSAILQAIHDGHLGSDIDVMSDLFPSQDEFDDMLEELPSNPIDATLAIVEPLLPPPSLWRDEDVPPSSFDMSGLCEYARIVDALLTVITHDRRLAKQNHWLLRHCMCLSLYANDMLLVPNSENSVFSKDVLSTLLQSITSRTQILTAMLLADVGEEGWHEQMTKTLAGGASQHNDAASSHISDVFSRAATKESIRDARMLYATVRRALNGATTADADQWMLLARKFETKARLASDAIILAVSESNLEPPRLDRLRNELAAEALGIKPHRINTDGLRVLHRLVLTTPDPDSDVVFLPQNRAVNFMKACQSWITSDEDVEEDVESEMLPVFLHLLPILQSVTGAHWDLVFDMIENNLENSTFDGNSGLVTLMRTLQLLIEVQELTTTNKALRTLWQERDTAILKTVRDLVSSASAVSSPSTPRSMCWELAFSIVQNLPDKLFDESTLAKMVHLLLDRSVSVQKMAYSFLRQAASRRTEHLVIEAGVDTSEEAKFELPEELLQLISAALEIREDLQTQQNMFGFLLGWMIVFDSFNDASLRVKISYANQLRDLGLVDDNLLPNVLDMLDLYPSGSKPFPLDAWSVAEYYVDYYDPDLSISPKLLSAHLFYRSLLCVPSLVSSWWSSLKNKQLSTSISSLATRHFSPVLIAAELAHVRDPDALAELSGDTENWKVKVASSISEVTASYTVDDQEMEIGIRLPPDYPLHGIEVKDVRRSGVEEKLWRGWLLAVQQVVTSQNGRIADGLSMFKKNVTHHFENQTECAICYSIISVTELSLPKKKCKTCKNRFHASCLYKWFSTSHTSSCPLCRSDFI